MSLLPQVHVTAVILQRSKLTLTLQTSSGDEGVAGSVTVPLRWKPEEARKKKERISSLGKVSCTMYAEVDFLPPPLLSVFIFRAETTSWSQKIHLQQFWWSFNRWIIYQAKWLNFIGSRFSNVSISCFSLFYMTVNWISVDLGRQPGLWLCDGLF